MKYTKSATFLFPLLQIPKINFKCDIANNFGFSVCKDRLLNVFMQDESVCAFETNHLFLLIRNIRDLDFENFNQLLSTYPNYVDNYENAEYMHYIFSIPEQTQADYDLILKGRYSEISDYSKKLIRENAYCNGVYHLLPLILDKMPKMREYWEERLSNPGSEVLLGDAEVWPIIDQQKEILTEEIIQSISQKSKLIPNGEFY